ncbi:hypothetical protein F1559_005040 [Cyanidiococcus yangmingshanensis]|uniref:N-acetyltransferase domain-containing protein n=1 Tax=Cyanidiococcus yangmingshanensis TaxID=2690220 RepID=A0A7J7IQR2_9RHOD|nr:hypothetical protein F1559_005040 [Cyanidiococcus yangmingshanensis]
MQTRVWKGVLGSAKGSAERLVRAPSCVQVGVEFSSAVAAVRVDVARTSQDAWRAAQVHARSFFRDVAGEAAFSDKTAQSRSSNPSRVPFWEWRRDWALQVLALEAWLGFRLRMTFRPHGHRLFLAKIRETTNLEVATGDTSSIDESVVGLVELSMEPVRFEVTTFTAALLDGIGNALRAQFPALGPQHRHRRWPTRRVYLYNLATDPEYRRRGIAQQLLAECEQQTRAWQHSTLYLHVERDNAPALRLYQRGGYRVITAEARRRPSNAPCLLGKWVARPSSTG